MSRWEVSVELENTRKAGISGGQNKDKNCVQKRRRREKSSLTEDGKEICSPKVEKVGRDMSVESGNSHLKNVAALPFSFP